MKASRNDLPPSVQVIAVTFGENLEMADRVFRVGKQ